LPRKRTRTDRGDEHFFYCQHCDTRWKTGICLSGES
jgi:DNA-directed RNA polymerase subunit M/transcription elongation factor TFIIS